MKIERLYTVPFGKAFDVARYKRVPRAVKLLRAFIVRHMKAEGMKITMSAALNEHLWARSIQKPPRRVKVRLIKDEGVVRAYLADEKIVEPKKPEVKEKKTEAEVKPVETKPVSQKTDAPEAPAKPATALKSAPSPVVQKPAVKK